VNTPPTASRFRPGVPARHWSEGGALSRSQSSRLGRALDFIALPLLLIVLFHLVPCVWGIGLSLFRYDAIGPARWAGLDNYRRLVHDPRVGAAMWATLKYALGAVPWSLAVGLLVALALDERWFRGKTVARTLFFLPNVISLVAVAFVWEWLFNPQYGILNHALHAVGLAPQKWLSDPRWALPCVILVQVWHGLGFTVIVYLAGLQGIPEVYYEAARLDGASRWAQVRFVTLPLLAPTVTFLSIMGVIGAFQVFQTVFIMTSGGPADATLVIVYYLWQIAFERIEFGYAAAIAVTIFLAILTLTLVQWRFAGRRVDLLG
jgi:multiple sugar transport system permease protein